MTLTEQYIMGELESGEYIIAHHNKAGGMVYDRDRYNKEFNVWELGYTKCSGFKIMRKPISCEEYQAIKASLKNTENARDDMCKAFQEACAKANMCELANQMLIDGNQKLLKAYEVSQALIDKRDCRIRELKEENEKLHETRKELAGAGMRSYLSKEKALNENKKLREENTTLKSELAQYKEELDIFKRDITQMGIKNREYEEALEFYSIGEHYTYYLKYDDELRENVRRNIVLEDFGEVARQALSQEKGE